jgi:hypothetical protein
MAEYGMAPFAFSIKKEGKDSAIGCEGDGHSLLGCRGVYSGRIPGTWCKNSIIVVTLNGM